MQKVTFSFWNPVYLLVVVVMFTMFLCLQALAEPVFYIKQFPENPKEGQEVFFNLTTDTYNISNANVIWRVDGIIADEGLGRSTFKYNTPKINESVVISAEIEDIISGTIKSEVILSPSPLFVMYEGADSYVPAFYKGRRLPGREGATRIGLISFSDLASIDWSVNGDKIPGLPKNTKVIAVKNRLVDKNLSVQTSIFNLGSLGEKPVVLSTEVPIQNPEVIAYKTNLQNIVHFPMSRSEQVASGSSLYVLLEPFWFSVNSRDNPKLRYTWTIDGIDRSISKPWFVKISGKSGTKTSSSVEVSQTEKILQKGEQFFEYIFK